ncbi:MAG: DUF6285 domain-containing protein [Planctomycetaceae bacterium]
MPTDRPTAAELLSAVREHLTETLAPMLTAQPAFHLRVAANSLATVQRTMEEGDAMDQAERARIQKLVGRDGDLLDLNRTLAAQIRSGELNDRREVLLTHLRQTAIDKLSLANPRYMTPRD